MRIDRTIRVAISRMREALHAFGLALSGRGASNQSQGVVGEDGEDTVFQQSAARARAELEAQNVLLESYETEVGPLRSSHAERERQARRGDE